MSVFRPFLYQQNTNNLDATVRDSAFEAIGKAYEVVGEKTMGPFLVDLDDIKKNRVIRIKPKKIISAEKYLILLFLLRIMSRVFH